MGTTRPTVVLTRAREDNHALAKRLEEQAIRVVEAPTAAIAHIAAEPDLPSVQAWARLAQAFAFSSRHGVLSFVQQVGVADLQRTGVVVAAVGQGTAQALRQHGVEPAVVAQDPATGAQLAIELHRALLPHRTVLIVQGRWARRELSEGLIRAAHDVRIATVYENVVPDKPLIDEAILANPLTRVYAAAPSAVARLLAWYPAARVCRWIAIGPTTANALMENGIAPAAVSDAPDLAATCAAILHDLAIFPEANDDLQPQ